MAVRLNPITLEVVRNGLERITLRLPVMLAVVEISADLVEVRVARHGERATQVDPAIRILSGPRAGGVGRVVVHPRVVEHGVRVDDAAKRGRHRECPCRSRRWTR
jgi:hypothetical protein